MATTAILRHAAVNFIEAIKSSTDALDLRMNDDNDPLEGFSFNRYPLWKGMNETMTTTQYKQIKYHLMVNYGASVVECDGRVEVSWNQ